MAHHGGDLMDIYVYGGDFENEVYELCENLIIPKNIKRKHLLDYGFTNFDAPYYYKVWGIIESDKYPVSFAMTIKKKGMKIESFDLLDENFMQPHPCGKEEFEQIEAIIKKMIDDGIICKNVEDKQ